MSEAKKTTSRKPANRSAAAKAPVEAEAPTEAPARKRVAKPTSKIIRNLRRMPVHVRFASDSEKPFRVALKPRGERGDTHSVPIAVTETYEFVSGEGVLFEIITETEARQLQYGAIGYQQREQIKIIREADTVVSRQEDWDGKGRQPQRRVDSHGHEIPANDRQDTGAGPAYTDVPGSDAALHQGLREGAKDTGRRPTADDMLPDGAFPQRLVVEHVRQQ